MSAIMALRTQYKTIPGRIWRPLGYMKFFIKATQQALMMYPELNAFMKVMRLL